MLVICFRNAEGSTDQSKPEQENKTSRGQETGVKPLEDSVPFQEPRVPYPHVSSLTERQQRRYLYLLSTYFNTEPNQIDISEQSDYSQYLVSG